MSKDSRNVEHNIVTGGRTCEGALNILKKKSQYNYGTRSKEHKGGYLQTRHIKIRISDHMNQTSHENCREQ